MRVIQPLLAPLFVTFCLLASSTLAETGYPSLPYDDEEEQPRKSSSGPASPAAPSTRTRRDSSSSSQMNSGSRSRKFFNDDSKRVDAGVFHVGFAAGGNFYTEPQVSKPDNIPTGEYFKDFGFQAGIYFDHDYSELEQNIPLMLRGMVGYKYILSSVHVFTFDGMVRRMFRFSEHASFGLGVGGSAAIWYRTSIDASADEEIIFLPSFVVGAGFEFDPFMVDFKWLINRFGADSTITGFELYFGFRL